MSLFDRLVDRAMESQEDFAPLRTVVEKELLHHDVLREMAAAGMLGELTFIGGTCLRMCYGSQRLSEDLDFTGGSGFERESLRALGEVLTERLQVKYGLTVEVSEPVKESGNADTWKLKVITRPERKNLPAQRINIDICALPSYDARPMVLRNHYGVDMGTSGLVLRAQSREEILADKFVAIALRPNRLKYRDLWDIDWLARQNVELPLEMVGRKAADRGVESDVFLTALRERVGQIQDDPGVHKAFMNEMRRFLPPKTVSETIENEEYWTYLRDLVSTEARRMT